MLEAAKARPRFTISLKRSTQNLQLSTGRRLITPSFGGKADIDRISENVRLRPEADIELCGSAVRAEAKSRACAAPGAITVRLPALHC
jgi:hypothetical protein